MKCPKCNQEIGEDSIFCPQCGEKLHINSSDANTSNCIYEVSSDSSAKLKQQKNKKPYIIIGSVLAIIVVIILLVISINNADSDSNYNSTNNDYAYNNDEKDNNNADIEQKAATALYKELKSKYSSGRIDLNATRYSIGTTKETGSGWEVRGTYVLYDTYGQYYKEGTFEVIISIIGGSPLCYLH